MAAYLFLFKSHSATRTGDLRGNPEAAEDAQRMLYFRAKLNQAAREGKYFAEMEVKEANNKILKSRSH